MWDSMFFRNINDKVFQITNRNHHSIRSISFRHKWNRWGLLKILIRQVWTWSYYFWPWNCKTQVFICCIYYTSRGSLLIGYFLLHPGNKNWFCFTCLSSVCLEFNTHYESFSLFVTAYSRSMVSNKLQDRRQGSIHVILVGHVNFVVFYKEVKCRLWSSLDGDSHTE